MATQTKDKDYYGVLGVKKSASVDDIRKAFRKLARNIILTSILATNPRRKVQDAFRSE